MTTVWDLSADHWLTAACDLVGRNLTRDEWRQHVGTQQLSRDLRVRTTVATMNPDIATRLAAAAGNRGRAQGCRRGHQGIPRQLVRCPTCDDTGSMTATHKVGVAPSEGTAAPCPYCGGLDSRGRARNDPEWVAWHCYAGDAERYCRNLKDDPTSIDETHGACGYRIILPLRLPPLRPDR